MGKYTALTRSIDSLERIYAFVGGFAIQQSLTHALSKEPNVYLPFTRLDGRILLAVAAVATTVPFIHGMNIHLDLHGKQIPRSSNQRKMMWLMALDFAIFMLECCLLYVLSTSVSDIGTVQAPNHAFIRAYLALLVVDVIWGIASSLLEDHHEWSWWVINLMFLPGFLLLDSSSLPAEPLFWLVALLALTRTLVDYGYHLDKYFDLRPDPE